MNDFWKANGLSLRARSLWCDVNMLPFDTSVQNGWRRERVESNNYEFVPEAGDQSEILQLTGGNQVFAWQVGVGKVRY